MNEILREAGLEGAPTNEKCTVIKNKRALQKEVDGLDTSLIIDDGKRPSRQRTVKPVYTAEPDSSDEEEDEEEQSSEEDDFSGDSDHEEPENEKSKKKSKKADSEEEESEASDEED